MNEGDDKLKKAWREVGAEEPSARVDAAILAAAHRAVAPKRLAQRWAVPVSLAAVLVLAVGVTLRMQQESPGLSGDVCKPARLLQGRQQRPQSGRRAAAGHCLICLIDRGFDYQSEVVLEDDCRH